MRSSAWHDTLDQAIADWNRMTAAKDLLEALKEYVAWHENEESHDKEFFRETGTNELFDALAAAKPAIAKAEPDAEGLFSPRQLSLTVGALRQFVSVVANIETEPPPEDITKEFDVEHWYWEQLESLKDRATNLLIAKAEPKS